MTTENTSSLLKSTSRFKYQTIKKISAALHYDYDYGVWLDSEAFALRPFSMSDIILDYIEHPTIWHSLLTDQRKSGAMQEIMSTSAKILGRSIDTYGERYWNLEK